MRKLALLLLFCAPLFAAKPSATYTSAAQFSGAELFAKLDEAGNNGNWMQLDTLAILDPAVAEIWNGTKNRLVAWGLSDAGKKTLFAVLSKSGNGEKIEVYTLKNFDAKPVPLAVQKTLYPEDILPDYKGVAPNEFEHLDNPNLKIKISESGIRFTYEKLDDKPLRFEQNFKQLSDEEKRATIAEYAAFFNYEYALMLRAFVQTTRGIFNWQPWHWYLPEWNSKHLISNEEIEAILKSGVKPARFRLFHAETSRHVLIEMFADGNGRYEMNVRLP